MPAVPVRPTTVAAKACVSLLLAGLAASAIGTPASPAPAKPAVHMARLRVEAVAAGYLVWADNLLAGPIEVLLSTSANPPPTSDPALPARASVAAGGSTLLARIARPGPGDRGRLDLQLRSVPGSSNARPQDVTYLPPLRMRHLRIDQGFAGDFSHQDAENRYALDFATPIGTPVHAARAGIVMQVETGFDAAAHPSPADAGRSNFIRILHADGSMGLYAHLATGGARVQQGQTVEAGQWIGNSGNTGYSTAPHLHFAVQVNRGLQLQSIRFRMTGIPDAAAQGR